MVYVGVLAFLIISGCGKIESALDQHFNGKKSAIEPNLKSSEEAFDMGKHQPEERISISLKAMQNTQRQNNDRWEHSRRFGGVVWRFAIAAWYPITPATSLAEAFNDFVPRLRVDPETNKLHALLFRLKMNLRQLAWLLVLVGLVCGR